MQLHLAYGLAVTYTMGQVETARDALATALALARELDHVDTQLEALWSLWVLHFNIGECRATEAITEAFNLTARRAGDESVVLIGERLRGYLLQHAGAPHAAQACFERVLAFYVPRQARGYLGLGQFDQRVLARAMLARVHWLQGRIEQALTHARASLQAAQDSGNYLSTCEALRLAVCPITLMAGDPAEAERSVTLLIDTAARWNATFWGIVGRCLKAKLLIHRGAFAEGTALLRCELDACAETGWEIWYPEFRGVLAQGLAGLGRFGEARAAIEQALARADSGGERYYVPELLRIKGELLLRDGDFVRSEQCLEAALDAARHQGAQFWELRGALSLARLRLRMGRRDGAAEVLAPVHARFTEGLDSPDLLAAGALLKTLAD